MTETTVNRDRAVSSKHGWGRRHVIAALLCFSHTFVAFSQMNISVAVVAMTSRNSSNPNFPIFDWTETQRSAPLSTYFAGHVVSSTLAGAVIKLFGAPAVLHASFICHAVVSAVVPLVTWHGSWLVLAFIRALIGFFAGFLDPLVFVISSKWFPPNERNFILNAVFTGAGIGSLLSLQICGLLAMGPTGWPSIFYFSSVPLLLFSVLWKLFGYWTPQECKTIKTEEIVYIEKGLAGLRENKKIGKTPWKCILTSLPVWAILVAELGDGIIAAVVASEINLFVDAAYGISVSTNGLLTAIPYYPPIIFLNIMGIGADFLLSKKILTNLTIRRIASTMALGVAASLIISYGFIGPSLATTVALMAAQYLAVSFCYIGYLVNPLDLSTNHSPSIVGLSRAVENVAAFATPLVFSIFLTHEFSLYSWRKAFIVTCVPVFLCNIFFLIFSRAELQPWDEKPVEEQHKPTNHQTISERV